MNRRIKTLLCGVGAVLLMAGMAEDATARGTGDVARVKGKDGVWTEVPLAGVREADGGVRYTFPAAEARKAQSVQFWLDRAQAKTGEDGFWMGGRGVVGYFTREKMRWVNGAQFMDHLIGLVDYVNYNTREIKNAQVARAKGRNLPFDRIVPFSELAFHDYLLANPDKSTQEFPSGQDWLDLVEFGGRPIVYKFTDEDAERIRDLYLRFKPLRRLQLEEMVEHRDVAPGVVRVTYGDGSRVYVNHTDALVEADGVRVPAMDYVLLDALRPDVHGGAARQSGREHDDLPARLETLGLHGHLPLTGT